MPDKYKITIGPISFEVEVEKIEPPTPDPVPDVPLPTPWIGPPGEVTV